MQLNDKSSLNSPSYPNLVLVITILKYHSKSIKPVTNHGFILDEEEDPEVKALAILNINSSQLDIISPH